MRKIIFRGKRLDNGEWVYGGVEQNSITIIYDDTLPYDNENLVYKETVGQFTGLPSQDKQDIYEGDRLFDYDDDYYIVEFSEGRFVAVGDGFEVDLIEIANRCSVIGNIHDQKEKVEDDEQT